MTHRFVCDHSNLIAAAFTITGMSAEYVSVETTRTAPQRTATTVQEGNSIASCTGTYTLSQSGLTYDSATGAATDVYDWSGCPAGVGVELWKDNGGVHIPTLTTAAYTAIENWYTAHHK